MVGVTLSRTTHRGADLAPHYSGGGGGGNEENEFLSKIGGVNC